MHHLKGETGPAKEEAVYFQGEIFTEPKGLPCHQNIGTVQKYVMYIPSFHSHSQVEIQLVDHWVQKKFHFICTRTTNLSAAFEIHIESPLGFLQSVGSAV